MLAVIAVFDRKDLKRTYHLKGKPYARMQAAYPDWADRLKDLTAAAVYVAGRDHASEPEIGRAHV